MVDVKEKTYFLACLPDFLPVIPGTITDFRNYEIRLVTNLNKLIN